jgi:ppGpp synthetase/RelA/SpoT-type nucleotidyltranferase
MNWSKLDYSKTQVEKAGKTLAKGFVAAGLSASLSEHQQSYEVLSNWRAGHVYPMQILLNRLRKTAFKIDENAIVVQRLKRFSSIIAKLQNEPGMNLARMEDIAGCRAVVDGLDNVYKVRDLLVNAKANKTPKRVRDYIKNPKKSGYRSIHLIYTYQGSKSELCGLPVELQLRSKVQHSWATSVEVIGTFLRQDLKHEQGAKEWLDFFECASEGFYCLESGDEFTRQDELERMTTALKVFDVLSAFSVATADLNHKSIKQNSFCVVSLNVKEKTLNYEVFPRKNDALELYSKMESEFKSDPNKDVVLVSIDSISALKKAYPNYFADTVDFIATLHEVLNHAI